MVSAWWSLLLCYADHRVSASKQERRTITNKTKKTNINARFSRQRVKNRSKNQKRNNIHSEYGVLITSRVMGPPSFLPLILATRFRLARAWFECFLSESQRADSGTQLQ
ncbi:hypothetical protein XENTR_v10011120 [Xenopus tropicalis]|nr:hypothetical protein XENTR_v10011120 [Xenopus tropicalis]